MMESDINYNYIPVYYCKHCLSLLVIDGGFMDYCGDCGGTDIGTASLHEYDKLYQERFGVKLFYPDEKL